MVVVNWSNPTALSAEPPSSKAALQLLFVSWSCRGSTNAASLGHVLHSSISDKIVIVQLALGDGSACLVASSLRGQFFSPC